MAFVPRVDDKFQHLLEILVETDETLRSWIPITRMFQPFLRFWAVRLLLETGADPTVAFQPFLRFWWRQSAVDLALSEFQPFLRFWV